ncbi:MAG: galactokinase, partial [Clostridia bacterium]|nr:galactokinase [Clostridia bacterium]
MNSSIIAEKIKSGALDRALIALYGEGRLEYQRERYYTTVQSFIATYGDRDAELFSVPGRTEISGN